MMFKAFKDSDQTSSRERTVRYLETGAYKAVSLPYRSSSISAVAVLPSEAAVKQAGGLAAAVADLQVSELLDGSKYRRVPPQGLQLHLPRFTVKSECVSLKEVRAGAGRAGRARLL
jgi:serine protease inhibitor